EMRRKAASRRTSSASLHVSQLIISVVSQRKHRGGISMVELKQALAGGGYDVFKYSRRVNVETKRLVNNETLVMTTRNTTFRLNNKVKQSSSVTLTVVKDKYDTSPALRRSPRKATTAPKIKAETRRPAAGSKKPARRTRKQPARRRKTIKRRQ
uniref:H15 domain-containing protein n=1 Tax=Acanthochromis polyacanthus TaxID=80966 RepID=A0A3Q1FVS8_9TELE